MATNSYGIEFLNFFSQPSKGPSELMGVENLCHIFKLHPLQGILCANLVFGDDPAHPADHSLVIVLQAMQIR